MVSLNLYSGVILVNTYRGRKERKENTHTPLLNDIYISSGGGTAAQRWVEWKGWSPNDFGAGQTPWVRVWWVYKSQVLSESQVQINGGGIWKQWQRVFFRSAGKTKTKSLWG